MKEEPKKEKKEKGEKAEKGEKGEKKDKEKKVDVKQKEDKKEKVKKSSMISLPAKPAKPKQSLSEMMTAESFRSTSLLATLTLIIVLSTVLLVIVAILVGNFRISLLTMASPNVLAGPVLMVLSSSLSILLAIAGFILVFKRHFNLYIGLAACSLLAFLFQLVAVVLAFLLRGNIDTDFNKVNVELELEAAASDPARMAVWDTMQVVLNICRAVELVFVPVVVGSRTLRKVG